MQDDLVLRNMLLQLFFLIFIIHMEKQTRINQNKRQVSISNIKTKTQMMIGAKVCVEDKFTNSDANTYDAPKRHASHQPEIIPLHKESTILLFNLTRARPHSYAGFFFSSRSQFARSNRIILQLVTYGRR
jgi:hypothetical protein